MIIIDASVAIKWFLGEEKNKKEALYLLRNHLSKKEEIIVPDLLFYEVANAFVTKVGVPLFVVTRSIKKIFRYDLHLYSPSLKEVYESTKLAHKYKTTVYDMIYAVVAKNNKAMLVTADERFREKTKFSFVKTLKEVDLEF